MSARPESARPRPAGRGRARWRPRGVSEAVITALLCAAAACVPLLGAVDHGRYIPPAALVLPLLGAGILLSLRGVVAVVAVVAVAAVAYLWVTDGWTIRAAVAVLVVAITAAVMIAFGRSRARLGVLGTRGESMLVDLRDQLTAQGLVPRLPAGWQVEVVHRSAHRARFSGDFLVAARTPDGRILELVLVDVSGKGLAAGTRALMLSGAFGGLLGALSPSNFLVAANSYLIRRDWPEGFATAAHVVIDLTSGSYEVRTAGHPPAVQYHHGSGKWRRLPSSGHLLGVFEDDDFLPAAGRLVSGDALLIYTDGLVEVPGADLDDGIDRLMGQAERLVTSGFHRGATRLVDAVAASEADDRALVLLWRS